MEDDPERPGTVVTLPMIDRAVGDAFRAADPSSGPGEDPEVITLLEETVAVTKWRIMTGAVRVETRTELRLDNAEVDVKRDVVDVTRVPVDRLVEEAPTVRTEGDITIVPVVEERFVIVKQFFIKEEIHIRRRTERETIKETVELRRQHAVVVRLDSDGRIIEADKEPLLRSVAEPPIQVSGLRKVATRSKIQDLVSAMAEAAKRLRRR